MNETTFLNLKNETRVAIHPTHVAVITQGDQTVKLEATDVMAILMGMKDRDIVVPGVDLAGLKRVKGEQ